PSTSVPDTAVKPTTQPQDSILGPPSTTIVQPAAQPVPVQPAGTSIENKTTQLAHAGATSVSATAPAKDLKNEPEPQAITPVVEDQAGDRAAASSETSETTAAPKHARPLTSP